MVKTTVYMPEWIHTWIKKLADEEYRSFNSQLLYMLEEYDVRQHNAKKKKKVKPITEKRKAETSNRGELRQKGTTEKSSTK